VKVEILGLCREFASAGLRAGIRTFAAIAADRSGVTIIDYGLFLGLVALALITGLQFLSGAITGMYDIIATGFVNSMPSN
jgi:Flp pilus assembly pilin Flp